MLWMEIGVLQPNKKSFIRIALVQHKRLSEGSLQILLSKYSPAWYGHGKISLALQLGYCIVCCWATLFYSIVPSLYLLKGISLFPQVPDEDVSQQYEKEIMEFGASSPMLTILATLALFNLYCFAEFVKDATTGSRGIAQVYETMALQILLWGVLILINIPLYQALYLNE
ncbi:hypothetical protein Pyn_26872 [Prunus yedoensis var. nudiflora]|uniref:Uncharacterized protein n=1 Tax=Prunus yedoensis var. nudiflora TaxID=2094558 RepID=A0A314ZND1_PRUYE|nr:hypothetical protein Pyn_26872 [Prunus yedoensis var. nudiflora]